MISGWRERVNINKRKYDFVKSFLEEDRYEVDIHEGKFYIDGYEKYTMSDSGYKRVSVYHNKRNDCISIHQIVAVAGGLDAIGKSINHKDGDKLNNSISNLEAVPFSENIKHAHKKGLVPYERFQGENNKRSKLTNEIVMLCRYLSKHTDVTPFELGRIFQVNHSNMHKIVHGKSWRSVEHNEAAMAGFILDLLINSKPEITINKRKQKDKQKDVLAEIQKLTYEALGGDRECSS